MPDRETLPPAAIARIDQRMAECAAKLDELVELMRQDLPQHGEAAAAGYCAQAASQLLLRNAEFVVDLLVTALVRLAQQPATS